MVGTARNGPSTTIATADPITSEDPPQCRGLYQAAQQFDLDATTCKQQIAELEQAIGENVTEAGACRSRLRAIEREIESEGKRRKYWSDNEQRFSKVAGDGAVKLSKDFSSQVQRFDENLVRLKAIAQKETANLDAVEHHQRQGLEEALEKQLRLLKEAETKYEAAMEKWVDCCFNAADEAARAVA